MIKLDSVTKKFKTGNSALSDVTFSINPGEFVFIVGPSGSGKTTLFRLLIREMLPTSGSITVGNWDLVKLSHKKVPHLRKRIGVVFQDLKLLRDRTIFENILFPLEVGNMHHKEAKKRVEEILEQVGIAEHKDKFPVQLSGGELQRAAIARALAFSPEIILADEPTGNLDITTSWEIVKLLQDINSTGTTVLMATHNTDIINSLLKRVLTLEKGVLIKDESREKKEQPAVNAKKE
jgi:cell division transport system ATP-binding protein